MAEDAAKIAEENAVLRKTTEHNEVVQQQTEIKLKALRELLSDARKDRDAALLENQNLKRKRESSNSHPYRKSKSWPDLDSQPRPKDENLCPIRNMSTQITCPLPGA